MVWPRPISAQTAGAEMGSVGSCHNCKVQAWVRPRTWLTLWPESCCLDPLLMCPFRAGALCSLMDGSLPVWDVSASLPGLSWIRNPFLTLRAGDALSDRPGLDVTTAGTGVCPRGERSSPSENPATLLKRRGNRYLTKPKLRVSLLPPWGRVTPWAGG